MILTLSLDVAEYVEKAGFASWLSQKKDEFLESGKDREEIRFSNWHEKWIERNRDGELVSDGIVFRRKGAYVICLFIEEEPKTELNVESI